MIGEIKTTFGETTLAVTEALGSFTQEQFNAIPFEGSWTAGQVADHVYKSSVAILQSLNSPGKKTERNVDERLPEMRNVMMDFEAKFKSPRFIVPEKSFYSKQEVMRDLQLVMEQIQEVTGTMDLAVLVNHPVLGEITKLEMFHFLVYHTQRHIHQLRNIAQILIDQHAVQPVQ